MSEEQRYRPDDECPLFSERLEEQLVAVTRGEAPNAGRFCGHCYTPLGAETERCPHCDTATRERGPVASVPEAVIEMLAPVSFVVLTTSRTDKYDRYLADVFCLPGATTADEVLEHGVYLNQRLLDEGLAGKW